MVVITGQTLVSGQEKENNSVMRYYGALDFVEES
jgi:hypothetical protein